MSAADTARASYEASRNEILERIRLRDNALLAFLGATGVVFGVASSIPPRSEFFLILPYLSLAAALIVTQHDRTIGCICAFITQELDPFLREQSEHAPTWEACNLLRSYSSTAMALRLVSHGILILGPPVFAMILAWPVTATSRLLQFVWWCAVIVIGISVFFVVSTHLERRKLYRETHWHPVNPTTDNK